jgi:hypothetical protein
MGDKLDAAASSPTADPICPCSSVEYKVRAPWRMCRVDPVHRGTNNNNQGHAAKTNRAK